MRKMHLIVLLLLPPLLLSSACSSRPGDNRREGKSIGTSAQVQNAILAIEDKNNKNQHMLAAKHSWQLWEFLNANESASPTVSGNTADTPKWIRWCQAYVAFYVKKKEGTICPSSSNGDKFRSSSPEEVRLVFHQKFRNNTALTDIGETVHLSPGFVASIRSLLSADGKCGTSDKPDLTLIKCAEQELGLKKLKAVLASGKLDPMSTIVKASWLHIPQPKNGENVIKINPWNGMASLNEFDNSQGKLNGGIKFSDWGTTPVQVALPQSSPNTNLPCGGNIDSSHGPSFADFYHLQICNDQFTNQSNQWKKGDYLLLLGLHVMTNLSSSGNWTWSTFYWHPKASEALEALEEDYSLKRSNNLNSPNVRPKMEGWRKNYRMDLQYSAKEEIPVDKNYIGKDPSKPKKPISSECNVDLPLHIPQAVFNPYIEGKLKCGGFSNCMGCHSHARLGGEVDAGLGNSKNRIIIDPNADKSAEVYTHFVWSLVNPK